MEEMRARIAAVVVVALVVFPVALQSTAWGQVMQAEDVEVVQVEPRAPRRIVRPPTEWEEPSPERIDELNRHREELAERARQRQFELQEMEQQRNARQRDIRAELREIHEQMAQAERELVQIERQQAQAQRRLLARAEDESARLNERLRNLQAQAERMQQTLEELRVRGGEQSQAVRNSLAETRQQMRRVEMQLQGLRAGRLVPVPPRREPMHRPLLEPEPIIEPPLPRGRRPAPEREEMRGQPGRPTMEMQEQLGDMRAQLQANSEKVDQIGTEVGRLNESLAQTQERVKALSPRPCPGTIGSAGYGYGWQPNHRLYYVY